MSFNLDSLSFYYLLCASVLEYGSIVWEPYTEKKKKKY